MKPRQLLLDVATGLIVVCCVVVTSVFVVRQVQVGSTKVARQTALQDRPVNDWAELQSVGHRIGRKGAAVTIVEFADFECPACRGFFSVLEPVRAKYPNDIALVFRHWPLGYHRFAYPSARAARCVGAQGKFEEFYTFMYTKQDSLGLIPFPAVATRIGVPNLKAFETCYARPGIVKEVEDDIVAAHELKGTGTPTLIINGVVPARFPTAEELEQMVLTAKAGKSPR